MDIDHKRARVLRRAWAVSTDQRFVVVPFIEATAALAPTEPQRERLRQALPKVWDRLDELNYAQQWLVHTGLEADDIDAINAALDAGLPVAGRKANLHQYALRPADFAPLLFLAFIAARLATPYVRGGPHRKIREQFWHVPELAIIIMRCLPPKLDLAVVEEMLRIILVGPEVGWMHPVTAGVPIVVGEPLIESELGRIEEDPER